jgi:hypothetical protein
MSISFGEDARAPYAKVWSVEDKGNYVKASLSTSRKDKNGTYENSHWMANFVGKCAEKAKELSKGDSIKIISGALSTRLTEDKKSYTNMVIFAYEYQEPRDGRSTSSTTKPESKSAKPTETARDGFYTLNEDDEDLPF